MLLPSSGYTDSSSSPDDDSVGGFLGIHSFLRRDGTSGCIGAGDFDDESNNSDGLPQRGSTYEFSIGPSYPSSSTRCRQTAKSQPDAATDFIVTALSGSLSPSPGKPVPLALRSTQAAAASVAEALNAMKCGAGGAGNRAGISTVALRMAISQSSAHATYVSHPLKSMHKLPSIRHDGLSQPLCSAYSNSSRSYPGGAQWLAVGDDEGTLTLINTFQRHPESDTYTCPYSSGSFGTPSRWDASSGSLFALSWRFDDRLIASCGADYTIKVWDTASGRLTSSFHGSKGTARAIEWDPFGHGDLLASAGRDGAIHVYDIRAGECGARQGVMSLGDVAQDSEMFLKSHEPLLSLWSAHTPDFKGKRRSGANVQATKGVTSLLYHRTHEHNIITTGCNDARIKLWDLRFAVAKPLTTASELAPRRSTRTPFCPLDNNSWEESGVGKKKKARKPRRARQGSPYYVFGDSIDYCDAGPGEASAFGSREPLEIRPVYESCDVSMSVGRRWNARPHGISSIVAYDGNAPAGITAAGESLWAACTDGRIYGLPYDLLEPGQGLEIHEVNERITTLFHPSQLGNSLYNRVALAPDGRTLAMGCNSGDVVLWDTKAKSSTVLQRFSDHAVSDQDDIGAHQKNCEVNSLSWCYGRGVGWKLASAGDDCVIRTWEMDRLGVEDRRVAAME